MTRAPGQKRAEEGLQVLGVYATAAIVALGAGFALGNLHPLIVASAAHLAATLTVFMFSMRYDNSSLFDPFWSVAPPALVLYFATIEHDEIFGEPIPIRAVLVSTLVFIWALRLTYNWWRGWPGLKHEDWRYVEIRERSGEAYPLASLFGIHLTPSIILFAGCLPLWPALATGTRALGALDIIAAVVTAGAILIEGIADNQLRGFREREERPDRILGTGLWAYSRHPNYFGEATFWWGLYLFALAAAGSDGGVTIAGAITISTMFWFISIPLLDKRSVERRRAYTFHMERVSSFVPWFPKKPTMETKDP